MTPDRMLEASCDKLASRIADMDAAPSVDALFDISAVAELLLALPEEPAFMSANELLGTASLRWLRAGMLEGILMSHSEHSYHVSLLMRLAMAVGGVRSSDRTWISNVVGQYGILKVELPTLMLRAADLHFSHALGVAASALTRHVHNRISIDKRVLRCRTDEQDVSALCVVAQLFSADDIGQQELPGIMPHVMLLHSIRTCNLNWIAILALLKARIFCAPSPLLLHARTAIHAGMRLSQAILPQSSSEEAHNEYTIRARQGLRIRSSLACVALLTGDDE